MAKRQKKKKKGWEKGDIQSKPKKFNGIKVQVITKEDSQVTRQLGQVIYKVDSVT